ncbi:MAG: hypothetical protein WCO55_03500 [Candidatus Falkowbacteria bacterium]
MKSNRWLIVGTIMVCGSIFFMSLTMCGAPPWLAFVLSMSSACVGCAIQLIHIYKIKHGHELEMKLSKEKHDNFLASIEHLSVEEKVKAITDYWEN